MGESGADRLHRLVDERNAERARRHEDPLWPNQVYVDAVWDSEQLTSTQKITALCYAKYANARQWLRCRDRAWVVYSELKKKTGIRSRETIAKVHADLVALGWLEPAGPSPGHRQRIVYKLALPVETGTDIRTGTESGTGTVAPETGTDIAPDRYGFPPDQYRNPHRTGTESGTRTSVREDSQKDSLTKSSRRADAATLRAASANAEPRTADDQAPAEPVLPAAEAIAQTRALLAGKRQARISRWPRTRAEDVPNPLFAGFPRPEPAEVAE